MSTLKSTLESLASQFAMSILNALRSASIEEVMGVTGARASGGGTSAPAAPVKRGPGRPKKVAAAAPAAEPAAPAKRRGRPGRLPRRSAEDIGGVVDSIFALLQSHPEGLRAEQIRAALDLHKKELPRPLAEGLATGAFTKEGQKRATTYFAGSGGKAKKRGR